MYYEYFGLKQPPFRITPDTNLFFPGANRGAILEALIYAVGNGEGIVKVVGEVGSGKTMLCRMLEQELPDRVEVVYLANPSLAPENILHVIAFELKLPVSADTPRVEVMRALQEYLLQRHAGNRQVVVFVEEAQGMPIATLEEIRLLSNLETRQNKLLQIVLFGQPELDEKLAQPEIRQLKERITYSFQLPPFNPVEIRDYLNARVRSCGYRAAELFSPGAVHAIAIYSQGLVRRINIIADKSLLAAYADTTIQVSKAHVEKAAKDSEFSRPWQQRWLPLAAAAGAAVIVLLLAALWWVQRGPGDATAAAPANVTDPGVGVQVIVPEEENAQVGAAETASATPVATPDPTPESSVAPAPDPVVSDAIESEASVVSAPVTPDPAPEAEPIGRSPTDGEDLLTPTGMPEAGSEMPALPGENVPESAQVADPPAATSATSPAPTPGLAPMFEWQADGNRTLSVAELERLQRMVSSQPPEEVPVAGPGPADTPCELCSGIVYRLLSESESL